GITPGAQLPFHLPSTLSSPLKGLARARGITPFAAFVASLQAYLSRLSNQGDVLSFASMAARTHPALRNIIGLVANVLPLRLDLGGTPSFNDVLCRAGEMVSSTLANQNLPLRQILEFLSVTHSEAPALQTLVIYNNAPLQPTKLTNVTLKPSLELDN